MYKEEIKTKHDAERAVVIEAGGSDLRWKAWILIILCLEVIYIMLEFGFNAALLNVASGIFPGPESLDDIEMSGRILSGVGFGLLIYGLLGMKYKERIFRKGNQVKLLALIMPIAIGSMYVIQDQFIENVIVENSTDEERFAATYLNMVRPAIRNGTLILEDVPITQETSDRPENKAFLAIAGMLMASNGKLVEQIPREIENIVGAMVHRKALEAQGDFYTAYRQVDERVLALYEKYQNGVASMPNAINQSMREVKASEFYRNLDGQLSGAYRSYVNGSISVYKAIGSKTYFKPYYVANACNYRKTNYFPESCRANIKKHGGAYYEMTGTPLNVRKFCDNRTDQKCDWSAERVGRIVYGDLTAEKRRTSPFPLTVGGIPLGLSKRQFYQHKGFAKNFGTQRHKGISLKAEDLELYNSGVPNAEASVRKALAREMKADFIRTINRPLKSGNDIEYGMNKAQFFRTESVQSAYRAVLGDDGSEIFVAPGLSDSGFLDNVLLPMSWKTVEVKLEGIPKSVSEMMTSMDMIVQGKNAVRAMVVPPIALVLSLFFSLFTLSKVLHHIAAMKYIGDPKRFPLKRVKLTITGTFLFVVMSFPFILSDNPMVKTGIVEAATGISDSQEAPSKIITSAMDWMIRAEPVIYPMANAFIGIPTNPFRKYHDANAQNVGTDDVGKLATLKLIMSLPVSEAQRILNALGYSAGPVDGMMGSKTMKALKGFQKSRGLTASGVIDAETSMALSESLL